VALIRGLAVVAVLAVSAILAGGLPIAAGGCAATESGPRQLTRSEDAPMPVP
jgi:hypothetical protein